MKEKLGIEIIAAESMDVLAEADVICTATTSTMPVFKNAEIGAGVHINGVGSYRPDMCEIPPETMRRAKIVVDQMAACLSEAGDILKPIEQGLISKDYIYGELGEIVTGVKSAREAESEITVFKSVGLAVQDLATADLVLTKARKLGLGTEVIL
jgi:ornithine cyclodeaminase/alanine dehydrogenase-like protein (mu-crystallin family)